MIFVLTKAKLRVVEVKLSINDNNFALAAEAY